MHKLTVRELIEELQRQDPDAIVTAFVDSDIGYVWAVDKINEGNLSREVRITFTQE